MQQFLTKNQEKPQNIDKIIRGNSFFITWPQNNTEITQILALLVDYEKDFYDIQVVPEVVINPKTKEKHQHRHAYIIYRTQKKFKFNHFDYVTNTHPNIQKFRNKKAIIEYMVKQNIPIGTSDIWETALKIAYYPTAERMLRLGYSPSYIFNKYSHIISDKPLTHLQRLQYQLKTTEHKQQEQNKKGIKPITRDLIMKKLNKDQLNQLYYTEKDKKGKVKRYTSIKPCYKKILDYINDIPKYKSNRPHKFKVLCITAPSNYGKTTLLNKLEEFLPSWQYPTDGWYNGYEDNLFWLIEYNQWTIGKNYEYFLQFLEGKPINLPIKGSKTLKTDNPSIILTSQTSLKEHIDLFFPVKKYQRYNSNTSSYETITNQLDLIKYTNALDALCNRINEVILPSGCTLFPLIKLIIPLKKTKIKNQIKT